MKKKTRHFVTRLRYNGFRRLSYPIRAGLASIPITVVLLVILLPIFAQMHSHSYHNTCLSNQKLISSGIRMYAEDYDDMFPVGSRFNRRGTAIVKDTPRQAEFHAGQGWAGLLYPYIKNCQVLKCFEDETKVADGLYPVSYAYNRNIALNARQAGISRTEAVVLLAEIAGNRANAADAGERSERNVYSAAGNGLNILAATDGITEPEVSAGARYATGMMGKYGDVDGCLLWPLAAPQEENPRHIDGANFALADGHVKFCKPADVSPGDNAQNAKQAQDCFHQRAAGTANLGVFKATFSAK